MGVNRKSEKNMIIWKKIKNSPGAEVSSQGKIRRCVPGLGHSMVKTTEKENGYAYAQLSGVVVYVHRVVAEAFIENPQGLPSVKFLDGDRTNCNVDNLMWSKRPPSMHNIKTAKVERNNEIKAEAAKGATLATLAEKYGISKSRVSKIVNPKK